MTLSFRRLRESIFSHDFLLARALFFFKSIALNLIKMPIERPKVSVSRALSVWLRSRRKPPQARARIRAVWRELKELKREITLLDRELAVKTRTLNKINQRGGESKEARMRRLQPIWELEERISELEERMSTLNEELLQLLVGK